MKHKPAQTSLTSSKPAVSDETLYLTITEHLRTHGMASIYALRSTLLSNPPTSTEIDQLDRVLQKHQSSYSTNDFTVNLLQQDSRPHYVQTWSMTRPSNRWSRW
ncbi:MAG: hypothetical protein WAZ18_01150 [Alphaproteobacteria bacterium]